MNEFERKLRRQPLRKVPAEWECEIFASLDRRSAQVPRDEAATAPWQWREWLWPAPAAWAALLVLWFALLALYSFTPAPRPLVLAPAAPISQDAPLGSLFAFQTQHRLAAELIDSALEGP